MHLGAPLAAVLSPPAAAVLAVLVRAAEPLSGREIARRSEPPQAHTTANRSLEHLVTQGIVHVEHHPHANVYVLNREHLVSQLLVALADLRAELRRRIRRSIERWPTAPVSAILYGSVARGDADTDSDVDLLLVRPGAIDPDDPEWGDRIADLSADVWRWTGNHLAVAEYSTSDWQELVESGAPLVVSVAREGRLLVGEPVRVPATRR